MPCRWQCITSVIGIILVVVFFITSSDSGSLVIDTIAAGGKVNAPTPQRIFWCTFEGLVAYCINARWWVSRSAGDGGHNRFPFTIVLLVATVSLIKGLMSEPRKAKAK
ncbi:BCCT family transporter [Vibrio metschnikovii]